MNKNISFNDILCLKVLECIELLKKLNFNTKGSIQQIYKRLLLISLIGKEEAKNFDLKYFDELLKYINNSDQPVSFLFFLEEEINENLKKLDIPFLVEAIEKIKVLYKKCQPLIKIEKKKFIRKENKKENISIYIEYLKDLFIDLREVIFIIIF